MELLRGETAARAVRQILNGQTLPALGVDPGAIQGERLTFMAIATPQTVALVDPTGTDIFYQLDHARTALGAYDAKSVHRALLRAGAEGPNRWACIRLSEQLLSAGRDWDLALPAIAQRYGHTQPFPVPEAGFVAFTQWVQQQAILLQQQIDALKANDLARVSKIEAAAVAPIAEMEHVGVPFDAEAWDALHQQLEAEHHALQLRLHDHFAYALPPTFRQQNGPVPFNLDSPQELKEALHGLGYRVPNVRRDNLEGLPAPLGPTLVRYRELSKRISAYGANFLQHVAADGRIHPTFEQIGASTGRMACRNPNLQAMVADAAHRDCFRCAPDHRLVIADYATCELRILAEMSGDPVFHEAFVKGDDLHAQVATALFGVQVSKTENPELRQRAKAVNFGLVYGMGAAGLARAIDAPLPHAQDLLQKYFRTFPRIREFLEETARTALRRGYALTLTGRRLVLDPAVLERSQAERIAKNMPIQGSSADITKLALAGLRAQLRTLPGASMVNAVHDEIVVECRAEDGDRVAAIMQREMVGAGQSLLPRTPVAVDVSIGRVWSK